MVTMTLSRLWEAAEAMDDTGSAPADLEALFARARGGDGDALEVLCREMRPKLYRAAFALLRDADEADDIAQDALVRAVTRKFLFLGRGSVTGWMVKIAVNLAKNRLRDKKRRREIVHDASEHELAARGAAPSAGAPADARVTSRESGERFEALLAGLSERQRQVVELRVVGELSFAEIGSALGIKEANARVTFHQAKKRLETTLVAAGQQVAS
jgi:RNA polymerase sigma-70 factor (ECF subfamily)